MPRKSPAALAAAPTGVAHLPMRPQAPAHLNAASRAIWEAVTASRPVEYFDKGSLGLLEAYCRALAEHRRIMAVVEGLDPAQADFCKLSRIADAHAARVSQLATRMRLSHQSRADARGAGRAAGVDSRSASERIRANYGSER